MSDASKPHWVRAHLGAMSMGLAGAMLVASGTSVFLNTHGAQGRQQAQVDAQVLSLSTTLNDAQRKLDETHEALLSELTVADHARVVKDQALGVELVRALGPTLDVQIVFGAPSSPASLSGYRIADLNVAVASVRSLEYSYSGEASLVQMSGMDTKKVFFSFKTNAKGEVSAVQVVDATGAPAASFTTAIKN